MRLATKKWHRRAQVYRMLLAKSLEQAATYRSRFK